MYDNYNDYKSLEIYYGNKKSSEAEMNTHGIYFTYDEKGMFLRTNAFAWTTHCVGWFFYVEKAYMSKVYSSRDSRQKLIPPIAYTNGNHGVWIWPKEKTILKLFFMPLRIPSQDISKYKEIPENTRTEGYEIATYKIGYVTGIYS